MGISGLGTLLVREGLLSEQDRMIIGKSTGSDCWAFAKGVLASGLLNEDELAAFLAERTRFQAAPRGFLESADPEAIAAVDANLLQSLEVFPIAATGRQLTVAVVDPLDKATVRQLEFFSGYRIKPVIASLSAIRDGIRTVVPHYQPRPNDLEGFFKKHAPSAFRRQSLQTRNTPASAKVTPDRQSPQISKDEINADFGESSFILKDLPPIDGDASKSEGDGLDDMELESSIPDPAEAEPKDPSDVLDDDIPAEPATEGAADETPLENAESADSADDLTMENELSAAPAEGDGLLETAAEATEPTDELSDDPTPNGDLAEDIPVHLDAESELTTELEESSNADEVMLDFDNEVAGSDDLIEEKEEVLESAPADNRDIPLEGDLSAVMSDAFDDDLAAVAAENQAAISEEEITSSLEDEAIPESTEALSDEPDSAPEPEDALEDLSPRAALGAMDNDGLGDIQLDGNDASISQALGGLSAQEDMDAEVYEVPIKPEATSANDIEKSQPAAHDEANDLLSDTGLDQLSADKNTTDEAQQAYHPAMGDLNQSLLYLSMCGKPEDALQHVAKGLASVMSHGVIFVNSANAFTPRIAWQARQFEASKLSIWQTPAITTLLSKMPGYSWQPLQAPGTPIAQWEKGYAAGCVVNDGTLQIAVIGQFNRDAWQIEGIQQTALILVKGLKDKLDYLKAS